MKKNILLILIPFICLGMYSTEASAEVNTELRHEQVTYSPEGKHLFILSGQSNMARLPIEKSFVPTINKNLGADNVIIIKHAIGGQPIRRWYKNWPSLTNKKFKKPTEIGDIYDELMHQTNMAIKNKTIASVTFIWVQGETDATQKFGDIYEKSVNGLWQQLSHDLNFTPIRLVLGRLSDFGNNHKKRKEHWLKVRQAQMNVVNNSELSTWVNTDDLNDVISKKTNKVVNDLHYSKEGYLIFGTRIAQAALTLLKETP